MQGCFLVSKKQGSKYDIDCARIDEYCKDGIPVEQHNLYCSVEDVAKVIRSLKMTNDDIKNEYFSKLLTLSQAGLVGKNAQPELAMDSLEKLKAEMLVNESGRIKNKYMIHLGIAGVSIIALASILSLMFYHLGISYLNKYIFIFQGAMIGTWVSFGARKVELKFEELSIIEKDRLNPLIRLIFIGISSEILFLFINSEIVTFQVGNISSGNIANSVDLQVLLGVISGLLEYKLAIDVFNKANSIIKF
ncbi:UNVERIFIED_ORG: hypothetical protein B2H98_06950 [Clostridium botulinum]